MRQIFTPDIANNSVKELPLPFQIFFNGKNIPGTGP